ncbi:MAG: sigma-54-dependent Fis family transcriptional regulator [Desulfobacterales bacterium]|nr:sigma-54-dependent Fis family transcriptional regulator [Desulfobacterales bacterium]
MRENKDPTKIKKNQNTVMVVDDDESHRTMLSVLIGNWGYKVFEACDGSVAINLVKSQPFDLILMDIRMIEVSGIEALEQIKDYNPSIPVIIMTAYSSVNSAVSALKKGAYDYLTKPLDFDNLKISMERAMEHIFLKKENKILKEVIGKHFNTDNIIYRSHKMIKLFETVSQVASSEATILITGESGTGKELIAGSIHFNSHRKNGPFVKINCAAITETLLESELFGHEKGAFTGADRQKDGKFLQANTGTIFLDEVSEMSQTMQVKLLRVLQEREVIRVGGDKNIKIDVRVIAATNKNLLELISKGLFRHDLYYRLNVISLELPPLRERREDIPILTKHFLEIFSSKNMKKIKGITPSAMDYLIKYDWHGNVRELMNVIERAVVLSSSEYLDNNDFYIRSNNEKEESDNDIITLDEVEKNAIIKTLELTKGNKSETSRNLGITRKTLHTKLKKYGII